MAPRIAPCGRFVRETVQSCLTALLSAADHRCTESGAVRATIVRAFLTLPLHGGPQTQLMVSPDVFVVTRTLRVPYSRSELACAQRIRGHPCDHAAGYRQGCPRARDDAKLSLAPGCVHATEMRELVLGNESGRFRATMRCP